MLLCREVNKSTACNLPAATWKLLEGLAGNLNELAVGDEKTIGVCQQSKLPSIYLRFLHHD